VLLGGRHRARPAVLGRRSARRFRHYGLPSSRWPAAVTG
jgi:hypothetical protein